MSAMFDHSRMRGALAAGRGFTMVELVVVMVILAALAFVAIPRLNLPSLKIVPVAEQIAAEIRYAQNLAMTRANSYTFDLNGNTISINGPGAALSTGNGSKTFDGVTINGSDITFNPRFGRPDAGGAITVSGGSSSVSVIVEGETGYVYIQQ